MKYNQATPKNSPLLPFKPFMHELLSRVGGRMNYTDLAFNIKHQINKGWYCVCRRIPKCNTFYTTPRKYCMWPFAMIGQFCCNVSYKCSTLSLSDIGVFNKNLSFSLSFILSHCLCISRCISNGSSTSIIWFLITFLLNEVRSISPLTDRSSVSIFHFSC